MSLSRLALCVTVLSGLLLAHGGQYRGRLPADPPTWRPGSSTGGGIPFPSGLPGATPGGGGGGPTGPTTGASGPIDLGRSVHWSLWWEFNKDPFLQARGVARVNAPATGSDDFYLGTRRRADRVDSLLPTEADCVDRIVPALAALLGRERNRDVQSATLIALGKVGRDAEGIALEPLLAGAIARDDQEVRESAVLSLGIAGRAPALATLAALVRDDSIGRQLEQKERVSQRTRAFAAYGLGLLAARSDDSLLLAEVQALLVGALQDQSSANRELHAAALTALGILGLDPAVAPQKLLLWRTVELLLDYHAKELGAGDELVQAHAAVAVARLLGRGNSAAHQRAKRVFADELMARQRRGNALLQSSALALGMLVEATAEDAEFCNALQRWYDDGRDRLSRYLSVIALGRIGGEANRAWLLRAYERGNKATDRPWLALALGLWANGAGEAGSRDLTLASRLIDDLADSASRDTQAALAVSVGLTGHPDALHALLGHLATSEAEEQTAGYVAVGLALLGDRNAIPVLLPILERSERRPFLLQQTAIALGVLGDRLANDRLIEKIQRAESVAVLAALARAISQIGDRRAIAPLIALLDDKEASKLSLAFVAAALGGIGDKDLLPWNLPLSVDCNYATGMDTLTNGATGVLDLL